MVRQQGELLQRMAQKQGIKAELDDMLSTSASGSMPKGNMG